MITHWNNSSQRIASGNERPPGHPKPDPHPSPPPPIGLPPRPEPMPEPATPVIASGP
jgi:hypothetical protein